MDRQRFPPPRQRLRQPPIQARGADRFGEQDPAGLGDRGHLRGINVNPGIQAGTVHLEGAPILVDVFSRQVTSSQVRGTFAISTRYRPPTGVKAPG